MARGPDRFRNYGAVLERHQKETKIRKIIRVFTFLFIIMIIVMLIVIVARVERRVQKKQSPAAMVEPAENSNSPCGALVGIHSDNPDRFKASSS